ncbi:MAG TPA: EamA family transporter [Iamia sp.]
MGALLAAMSSLLWGTGDFLGGTLSRRVHPVAVIRSAHGMAAVVVAVVVTATGEWGRTGAVGWGIAAGLVGSSGLGLFYAALARGTMGVVAPIAATGVVVPVAVGLAQGDEPGPVALAGIVVAIVGVVLVSGPERGSVTDPGGAPVERGVGPVVLALMAAVAFGSGQAIIAQGSDVSVAMTVFSMRAATLVAATALLATVLRSAARPSGDDRRTTATIATTDTGAMATFSLATTMGALSITAVLASLYPAVTAVLAWRVHGEQLKRIQLVGALATLIGVGLIAAG